MITHARRFWPAFCMCIVWCGTNVRADEFPNDIARVSAGLQLLFEFPQNENGKLEDSARVGRPIWLTIESPDAVEHQPGQIELTRESILRSGEVTPRLLSAFKWTNEITIEAWVQPASAEQSGPARIFTLSRNGSQRNFTLGQDGDKYDVRLRTSGTSDNGIPSLSSKKGTAKTELTHIVYTRNRTGQATLFIDGKKNREKSIDGDFANWDDNHRFALGNEHSKDRPWLGTVHLIALYNRALADGEIGQNFRSGPNGKTELDSASAAAPKTDNEVLFEDKIARLFSQHCLECHDPSNRKGDLDLSVREAAFAGGESGPSIVPGNPADSLLVELIDSDDMPKDRDPLSDDQKELLREWISAGANWTISPIDPVVYAHDSGNHQTWVRRLTVPEYIATVQATVGVDISEEARHYLPHDLRADGFRNTAYNLNVDFKHVEAYARLAEIIVDRMDIPQFTKRFTKRLKFTDDEMGEFLSKMGKWVLRGPLNESEVIDYRGISTVVAGSGGDYNEAISRIIQAMLQSPRFIYRIENQIGDGSVWPVGGYELANRLSYILWGASPDLDLMDAVEQGGLYSREQIEEQVERMLKDPRIEDRSVQFIDQWLNLPSLKNLQPNPARFPNWGPELADDMQAETRAFFKEIVWHQERPLSDLLNAQVTFVTPRLAEHYRIPLDDANEGAADLDTLRRIDVSSLPSRGGLLTQGSVLTVGGDDASTVTRGLFVMHDLLRGVVNDPPPCVDTTPIPTKPGVTQRTVAEMRISNQACGGCHSRFEPLSFGLEKFDGLGTFKTVDEHGNVLREDGEILFPGTAQPVAFETSAELMDLLAESRRVHESITWKVVQFSLGRPVTAHDVPIIDKIHAEAERNGGTYKSLLRAIVLSDLVLKTRTEPLRSELIK